MTKTKRILIGAGIGGSIGVLIVATLVLSRMFMHERLPAGTSIAGINLAFDKPEKALQKLEKEIKNYLESPLKINIEDRVFEIAPEFLGVEFFPKESVELVYQGDAREGSLVDFYLPSDDRQLPPIIKIDDKKLFNEIETRLGLKRIGPKSANFYFDENDNLAVSEERGGLGMDKEKLLADFEKSVNSLSNMPINLQITPQQPSLTKIDLEQQIPAMNETLAHNITLKDPIYSDDWNEKLIDHKDWITFEPNDAEKRIDIKINFGALNKFINAEISEWLDDPVSPVNIFTNDEDKIVIEGRGHKGTKIKREDLRLAIENAVADKITEIEIPIEEISPEMKVSEELADMGITEIIGIGHTSFYGSPTNRLHNVKVATDRFNGTLIAPDEIFSFNQNLGPVDGSTGYRKELVIKKEGTIPEYGGGVCQVSTTMYRAALFTGLPIEERNQHSYAVSYYSQVLGHGLDATIYLGGPDLQFRNDTGHHILVQSYVKDDYELYFIFYGTSDGRTVEMEGPFLSNYHSPGPTIYQETTTLPPGAKKQVENYHVGFSADWYRNVHFANGESIRELIETRYKAIPARVLVGAGAATEEPVPASSS